MKGKKTTQFIIIGVLVLVILGIGAFQLVGMAMTELGKAAVATVEKATKESEKTKILSPQEQARMDLMAMVQGDLPFRDPFSAQTDSLTPKKPVEPTPEAEPAPAEPAPAPRSGSGGGGGGGSRPRADIEIPPFNPLPGMMGDSGVNFTPGDPLPNPNTPDYNVKGVVLGNKPMAVIEDGDGKQRLVPLGGAVDGDSKVVDISRNGVTVEQNGERKTLKIEDGSHAK